jgi:hypothetical protein
MNAIATIATRGPAPAAGPRPAPQPDFNQLNSAIAEADCAGLTRPGLAGYNRLQRVTSGVTGIYQQNHTLSASGYGLQPVASMDAYTRARVRVRLCNSVTL